DLLADTSSPSFAQQREFANAFGADPIVVVVAAKPGKELLTPDHMIAFATLEGHLHGLKGVARVYGVGTLVNEIAKDVTDRASQGQVQQVLRLVDQAGKAPHLKDATVTASGTPALAASLAEAVTDSLKVLLLLTLGAMLLVSIAIPRGAPMRLLAVPLALLAL